MQSKTTTHGMEFDCLAGYYSLALNYFAPWAPRRCFADQSGYNLGNPI